MKKRSKGVWTRFKQQGKPQYDLRRAQAGYAYLREKYALETLPWSKNQLARVNLHRLNDRVPVHMCIEYVMAGDFFVANEDGERYDPEKGWAIDACLLHANGDPDKAAQMFRNAHSEVAPLMKDWPFYHNARMAHGVVDGWHDVAKGSRDYKKGMKNGPALT